MDIQQKAVAAALLFENFNSTSIERDVVKTIDKIEPYVPGEFYKRELPCLLNVLDDASCHLDYILIDGYVFLAGNKKGLGAYLYDSLEIKVPVIGIAKTYFHNNSAFPLLRGTSRKPLFITSIGIDTKMAAENIRQMHGIHRIPHMLKKVDFLCRNHRIMPSP
jgi:deoxyribonuclease V